MALDQRRVHAEQLRLRLVRVRDHAARHIGRGARPLGQPRGHQPARAGLRQRRSGGPPAALRPGRRPSCRPWRTAFARGARRSERPAPATPAPRRARGAQRPPPRPRRRQVVISSLSKPRHLGLGHPQRLRDLGLRDAEQPQHLLAVLGRGRRRPQELVGARRPPATSSAARAAAPAGRPPSGRRAVERRHHQPRRRAGRVDHDRALGNHRLLAVGGADRLEVEVAASGAAAA